MKVMPVSTYRRDFSFEERSRGGKLGHLADVPYCEFQHELLALIDHYGTANRARAAIGIGQATIYGLIHGHRDRVRPHVRERIRRAYSAISHVRGQLPIEPLRPLIYGRDVYLEYRLRDAFHSANYRGTTINVGLADEICTALGRHPVDVWGAQWWQVGDEETA